MPKEQLNQGLENQYPNGIVLLNEAKNEYVQSFVEHNDTGVEIELVNLELDSAIRKFVEGKYSAWVTGIDSTTGLIASKCREVIGLDQQGLLSSFFSMEKPGEAPLYLGDCALDPGRKPELLEENLRKTANKTVETLKEFNETPRVAFLASSGEDDPALGDVIGRVAAYFKEEHPDVANAGKTTWKEARDQGANTFFFPSLNAGNICYKILNDPDGGGWQAVASPDPHVNVLKKNGRARYLSSYEVHTPTAEELVEITVNAYNAASDNMPEGRIPRIALLSFATKNSDEKSAQPKLVREAIDLLKERYPELQIAAEWPLQWDSATSKRVFEKKTEQNYPGEPDVFIFPDRDSAQLAYEMLQEPDIGGRVAVGPIFQGLKGGKKVIDLSRGAREREIAGAVKTGGRSNVALRIAPGNQASEPATFKDEIAA